MRTNDLPGAALLAIATPLPYSFSFDGYVLDHVLFTDIAAARCVSVRSAHGNADVAEGGPATTDLSAAVRSADHDGFVVALRPGN